MLLIGFPDAGEYSLTTQFCFQAPENRKEELYLPNCCRDGKGEADQCQPGRPIGLSAPSVGASRHGGKSES